MSVQSEITRIQTARNTLRTKAVELGIAASTAKIDALATAYDGIENRGAVSAQVQEGDTYTIPKGYHNGNGTVSGVAGPIAGGKANRIVHGTYTAASAKYIAYHMFIGESPWIPSPAYSSGAILCRTDFELSPNAAGPQNVHLAVFIYSPTKMYIGTIGQRANGTSQQSYGQVVSRSSPNSFSDVANFGSLWTGYYNAGQKVTITETEIPDEIADYLFTFAEVTA